MRKKKIVGVSITIFIGACAVLIIAIIALILLNITIGGIGSLTWGFIVKSPENGMTSGGIFPAIFGTMLLVMLMSIVVIPVGTITAIYLAEYVKAESVFAKSIRFAVNTLAGIPSIVFGLFGLGFFIQFVGSGMDKLFSPEGELIWGQPSLLWASLTMALLTLPVVIVSVEEALKTVPREQRDASLALGASKLGTIIKVVLPQSITGILTGGILAISRGAGEVAPILFTGAAYFLPNLPTKVTDQFMELGYHIYIMSTQSTNVDETRGIQFATIMVLLLLTFALNFSALILRYQMRKRFKAA
jgi:phosphate transport system permease protein